MSENLPHQNADFEFGWARIENRIEGCFSKYAQTIEFRFDDSKNVAVKISAGELEKEISIEKTQAENFLKNIISLGRKTEVRSQSGWTTVRYSKAEWRNLNFSEETTGIINASSNEWTIEEMKDYLPKIKDAKIAAEIKEMLAKGLHRRAIEIHLETEKFIRQNLSMTAKS